MIHDFQCHHFRNLDFDHLELERLNVLIGPNNSGKTNFIRAISFLSNMVNNTYVEPNTSAFLHTVAAYGWEHMLDKRVDTDTPIDFAWTFDVGGELFEYKMSFVVGEDRKDNHMVLEELNGARHAERYAKNFNFFSCHGETVGKGYFSSSVKRGRGNKRLPFSLDEQETLLRQFKDILIDHKDIYADENVRTEIAALLSDMRAYFEKSHAYASSHIDTAAMRQPGNAKNVTARLDATASNFTDVYNGYAADLRQGDWEAEFRSYMHEMIPALEDIRIKNQLNGLVMTLRMGGNLFTLDDVSEGTLKVLVLNLLLHMPRQERPSFLAIDEPENNLHPAWASVLAEWLVSTGNFEQCFISTHSPELLDALTQPFLEKKVGIFVFDNGSVRKLDPDALRQELTDWELGDLYRVNDPQLGGWPW